MLTLFAILGALTGCASLILHAVAPKSRAAEVVDTIQKDLPIVAPAVTALAAAAEKTS